MRLQASFPKEKAVEVAHEHYSFLRCVLVRWGAEVYGKKIMEYGLQTAISSQLTSLIWAPLEIKKGKIVSVFLEWEGGIILLSSLA